MRWLILLVLGILGLVVAIAMGKLIRFVVIVVLTAVVFAIVIRKSHRDREQDKGERPKDS